MRFLLEANSPDFLWIADKPISLGGIPQKMAIAEVEKKFDFKYLENVLVVSDKISKFNFGHQSNMKHIWEKIKYRLQNPLHDNLVVCFINERVGYGVFAREFIEAGTIIGVYAGEIDEQIKSNDYGMSITDTPFRINAHQYGGITRFIQHMPFSIGSIIPAIQSANKDYFLKIFDGNSIYFYDSEIKKFDSPSYFRKIKALNIQFLDKLTKDSGEQEEILKNPFLKGVKNLATANIRSFTLCYKNKSIVYFQACCDIQPNQQLGVCYGLEYWNHKGISPEYFNKNGEVITNVGENNLEGGHVSLDNTSCHLKQFPKKTQWKKSIPDEPSREYSKHDVGFFTMPSDRMTELTEAIVAHLKLNSL